MPLHPNSSPSSKKTILYHLPALPSVSLITLLAWVRAAAFSQEREVERGLVGALEERTGF
jgi:hypothetical protein